MATIVALLHRFYLVKYGKEPVHLALKCGAVIFSLNLIHEDLIQFQRSKVMTTCS